MESKCVVLSELTENEHFRVALNGLYFIPSGIYLLQRDMYDNGIKWNWREKAEGSYTKMVLESMSYVHLSDLEYEPFWIVESDWDDEYEKNEAKEDCTLVPNFSTYQSRTNTITHYFIPEVTSCRVIDVVRYNGEVVTLNFERFETGLSGEDPGWMAYPADKRWEVAKQVSLSQKKVFNIELL